MNRLLVGFPLYYQVPASWFSRWLGLDRSSVACTVTINGAYLLSSMEQIVQRALERDDWDRLVIYEADMLPPPDALVRMAHYDPQQAVVGSMYFRHEEPHTAIVYVEAPGESFAPITPQTVADWCADPGLYRCGAVGFGLTSIARHVLEDWNPDVAMFGHDGRVGSHDIWFCERAGEQGHEVYVDTGILCEHLTQVPIGLSHNQACAHMIEGAQILDFSYRGD